MRKSWKVVLFIACAGILAYAWETREPPIPAAGTYRIQDATPIMKPDTLIAAFGQIAVFQVDYQGPREWAEIVVENWEGPILASTEILSRMKFGSAVRERHEWGINYTTGPAFSHERDQFSVCLMTLPEREEQGPNTFALVKVVDVERPKEASIFRAVIDVAANRPHGTSTQENLNFVRGVRELPDSESTLLWSKRTKFEDAVAMEPPFESGFAESRVLFRFVDH